jgi:tetratricopeptide (TPR) repeat protein
VALALACAAAPPADAQASFSLRRGDCYRDVLRGVPADFSTLSTATLQSIARTCIAEADAQDSRTRAANAYFHAGRANVALSARYDAGAERDPVRRTEALTAAIGALENAASDFRNPDQVYAAQLDLARSYRLRRDWGDAQRVITTILATPQRLRLPNAAAQLENALIYLDRDGDAGRDAALNYLDVFARPDIDDQEPTRLLTEGRRQLFGVASALGDAAYAVPEVTRETTQRAAFMYERAKRAVDASRGQLAGVEVAKLYANLGNARLRLAGLTGEAAAADYACAANQARPEMLNQALVDFRAAQAQSDIPDAHYGEGCAMQALGNTAQAVVSYTRAADAPGSRAEHQLALARALQLSNQPALAQERFRRALERAAERSVEKARIFVEIAKIHLANNEIDAALQNLDGAIATNDAIPEAYLLRGVIYTDNRPNHARANADLQRVLPLTMQAGSEATRARAYYFLSKIEVGRGAANGNATNAISNADLAVDLAEDRPEYKAQACLARVFFRRVDDASDAQRCDPGPGGDANAYLYAGMYHLRRTFSPRVVGGNQGRAWEDAIRAFDSGLQRLGPPRGNESEANQRSRALLTVGKGISEYCVGLATTGRQTINSVGQTQREQGQSFFEDYGLRRCADRR